MTFVSLTHAAQHLGIDGKTLQRWLAQAQLVPQPHPADARQKGVSWPQLQQLARCHQRQLATFEEPASGSSSAQPALPAELLTVLAQFGEQVSALQEQLQVLSQRLEHAALPTSPSPVPSKKPARPKAPPPAKPPAKPAQVLSRVESAGEGHYVIMTPLYGVLPFEPDSREWVGWLSVQTSFRFVGQQGHLTAHREVDRLHPRPWRACRKIRNHTHNLPLAHSDQLTIALLEQAAATFQAQLR